MINCRSLLYWGVRICLVLPQTPWSSFPELLSFSFYCKTLSFFVYSKSLPHICSSTNSLPPPSPPLPSSCSHSLKRILPLLALESRGIVNESALKRLVTRDSKYILQSKLFVFLSFYFWFWFFFFFEGFTNDFNNMFDSHIQGWRFSASSVYTAGVHHHVAADSPWLYLSLLG